MPRRARRAVGVRRAFVPERSAHRPETTRVQSLSSKAFPLRVPCPRVVGGFPPLGSYVSEWGPLCPLCGPGTYSCHPYTPLERPCRMTARRAYDDGGFSGGTIVVSGLRALVLGQTPGCDSPDVRPARRWNHRNRDQRIPRDFAVASAVGVLWFRYPAQRRTRTNFDRFSEKAKSSRTVERRGWDSNRTARRMSGRAVKAALTAGCC